MSSTLREPEPVCLLAEPPSAPRRPVVSVCSLLCCLGPIRSGYNILRVLLALVLLMAAGLKAYQLATEPVIGTGLLDSRWLLIATVEFELFLGLWLLCGISPKPTWVAVLASFGLFTCVSLYKAVSGDATCGCFGPVQVNPWYTTTFDLGVLLSLLFWRPNRQEALLAVNGHQLLTQAVGVVLVWLSVGLPAGYAMSSYTDTTLSDTGEIVGDGKIVVLRPETWIGKPLPLLSDIDVGDHFAVGQWTILFYHHDCPVCQSVLAILRRLESSDVRSLLPHLVPVEMPPYATGNGIALPESCGNLRGRLSARTEWFVEAPIAVSVRNSTVIDVRAGDAILEMLATAERRRPFVTEETPIRKISDATDSILVFTQ